MYDGRKIGRFQTAFLRLIMIPQSSVANFTAKFDYFYTLAAGCFFNAQVKVIFPLPLDAISIKGKSTGGGDAMELVWNGS